MLKENLAGESIMPSAVPNLTNQQPSVESAPSPQGGQPNPYSDYLKLQNIDPNKGTYYLEGMSGYPNLKNIPIQKFLPNPYDTQHVTYHFNPYSTGG
jgi:hypothetical protein